MSTLTASVQPALGPSWDETIVPTLRKRLESESRIISKRLSTVSITESIPYPDSVQSEERAVSRDNTTGVGSHSQRPSAIPRPSYIRERSVGGPISTVQTRSGETTTRRPGTKRQRTQSTPFSFDASSKSPEPSLPNGTGSLGLASRVQSSTLGGQTIPTPSRIPTVSRKRSASQSSQRLVNGGKASHPPSQITAPSDTASYSSETLPRSLKIKPSLSSLSKQRIIDEQIPFASESSSKSIEIERVSSDEERPFQHWYRGDVSRNGGVGEYRVGKRMEMLDIANYGHPLGPSRRKRAYEEPILSENIAHPLPRKRAESISSRERASIYIDLKDETTGRVLDEMPLTDVDGEETDYEQNRYTIDQAAHLVSISQYDYSHTTSELPDSHHRSEITAPLPQIPQPQSSRQPPNRSREPSVSHKGSSPPAIASTSTTKNVISTQTQSTTEQQRGRAKISTNRSKAPAQSKGQKRSKSAGDTLQSPATTSIELGNYEGLADAIPDTRVPVPKTGNWDDVILPTIARKMGIEYEQEGAAKDQEAEELFEPAPGTFGFDHSKYKPRKADEDIPMAEFGQRIEPPEEELELESIPLPGPKSPRSKRETMPTTPPFSHYHSYNDNSRERPDMPQIIVQQPPAKLPQTEVRVEEEGASCCKCVVM